MKSKFYITQTELIAFFVFGFTFFIASFNMVMAIKYAMFISICSFGIMFIRWLNLQEKKIRVGVSVD